MDLDWRLVKELAFAALSGRSLVRVEFREAEAEALSNFVRRMWQGSDFDHCK
ncbi:hypothetical protein CK203_052134 [Vitis vinifera]|uniref:Uncharacterized protein n=1 Tax=Vitis vinifera TaxID=29760 RepID=A0A438GHF3_VITVI|nr:hypothetical protein CK203_052134 [Vitis vinifera]